MENGHTKAPWWYAALRDLGIPVGVLLAILCVGGYMIWSGGSWVGENLLLPVAQKQIQVLSKMEMSIETMQENDRQTAKALSDLGALQTHTTEAVRANYGKLEQILVEVKRGVESKTDKTDKIENN